MKIWVDADACPVVIKEILCRAATKRQIETAFVANQLIRLPPSPWLKSLQVPKGFDVADDEIVQRAQQGDLVVTAAIPLAAEILAKGGFVITPRGERYTENTIKQRLQLRDFMETMRSSGEHTGGPAPMNQADRKQFADQLDRLLQRYSNV